MNQREKRAFCIEFKGITFFIEFIVSVCATYKTSKKRIATQTNRFKWLIYFS